MSEMRVMAKNGDNKLTWDANDTAGVEAAKEMFDKLTKKKYVAFGVKEGGAPGEKIESFDSRLEKIILVPPMRGG